MVKEANGDYFYSFRALNLSETGIYLENKICISGQEPFSQVTFSLPNGKQLKNITARMVRENIGGQNNGSAFEFLNISEETRMELRRFFESHALKGTA